MRQFTNRQTNDYCPEHFFSICPRFSNSHIFYLQVMDWSKRSEEENDDDDEDDNDNDDNDKKHQKLLSILFISDSSVTIKQF